MQRICNYLHIFSNPRLPSSIPSSIRHSSCFAAQLAELVDALVLGTSAKSVGVRVPHWAPKQDFRFDLIIKNPASCGVFYCLDSLFPAPFLRHLNNGIDIDTYSTASLFRGPREAARKLEHRNQVRTLLHGLFYFNPLDFYVMRRNYALRQYRGRHLPKRFAHNA